MLQQRSPRAMVRGLTIHGRTRTRSPAPREMHRIRIVQLRTLRPAEHPNSSTCQDDDNVTLVDEDMHDGETVWEDGPARSSDRRIA